jgi:hypothetical protein
MSVLAMRERRTHHLPAEHRPISDKCRTVQGWSLNGIYYHTKVSWCKWLEIFLGAVVLVVLSLFPFEVIAKDHLCVTCNASAFRTCLEKCVCGLTDDLLRNISDRTWISGRILGGHNGLSVVESLFLR